MNLVTRHSAGQTETAGIHDGRQVVTLGAEGVRAAVRSTRAQVGLWKEIQDLLAGMLPSKKGDLIFTENGEVLSYRRVQYVYNQAFKKAGLPHRSTHVCRHTGSTMFLDRTQDLLALQQLGGWKNQFMPQHYAKIRSHRAEQAMRASEKRLRIVDESSNSDTNVS